MRANESGKRDRDATAFTRTIRLLRHRTLRWFQRPIRDAVRDRLAAPVNRSESGDN
jgi:hypothetical protein